MKKCGTQRTTQRRERQKQTRGAGEGGVTERGLSENLTNTPPAKSQVDDVGQLRPLNGRQGGQFTSRFRDPSAA